jgi:hypothetical protein
VESKQNTNTQKTTRITETSDEFARGAHHKVPAQHERELLAGVARHAESRQQIAHRFGHAAPAVSVRSLTRTFSGGSGIKFIITIKSTSIGLRQANALSFVADAAAA